MASERPGLSPYNYVQNNPLNRWGPTGMIDWRKIAGGTITTVAGLEETITGGATKSLKGSLKSVDNLIPISAKEAKNITTSKKAEGIIGIGDIIGTTSSAKTVRSNYVEIVDDKKKTK